MERHANDEISRYSADNIDIFVGDIFDLSSGMLGQIDAIYDRAALVALPETVRKQYSAHLMEITDQAPQLLISYDYDQRLLDGPPFSISNEEVARHYQDSYDLKLLASANILGGLKGKCAAKENVWLLKKLDASTRKASPGGSGRAEVVSAFLCVGRFLLVSSLLKMLWFLFLVQSFSSCPIQDEQQTGVQTAG